MDSQENRERPYETVIVIPAGRRRYMELLLPQILSQPGWDRLELWRNTDVPEDVAFLRESAQSDPRIVVVEPPLRPPGGAATIGQFFAHCTDPRTVYIRFDDDIVFIEPGLIEELAEFRWRNPEFFVVSPAVVNNAATTYVLEATGKIELPTFAGSSCLDPVSWGNPSVAQGIHKAFIGTVRHGALDTWKYPTRVISTARFSINCISWLGSEFAKFDGIVPLDQPFDEEEFVSALMPTRLGKSNALFGEVVCAHYAFFSQRDYLDRTDLLDEYGRLVDDLARGGLELQGGVVSLPISITAKDARFALARAKFVSDSRQAAIRIVAGNPLLSRVAKGLRGYWRRLRSS